MNKYSKWHSYNTKYGQKPFKTIGPTTKVHQSEMVAFRIGRQLLHKKFIKGQITRHCLANYGVLRSITKGSQ